MSAPVKSPLHLMPTSLGHYMLVETDGDNAAVEKKQTEASSSSAIPHGYVKTDQSFLGTHVSSALLALNGAKANEPGRKRSGKKGKNGRELNKAWGNEGGLPFLKVPSTRSFEFDTVETLQSQLFHTSSTTIPTYSSSFFTISQVQDFSSFSAVFDQYRIRMIEVLLEPQVTEVTSTGGDVSEYVSCVDIDDANVPTVYQDLCSYSSAVQTKGTQLHYHRWVPGVAVAVYSGAFTSFASTDSMWLDCGSSTIQHYGLKIASLASTVAQTYLGQVKMHCSWRARH